jgi:hypothetical protein
MSLTLVNILGSVIVQAEDEIEFVCDEGADYAPAAPATSQPGERRGKDLRVRPIVLGPRTRPPLPTSIQLARVIGRPRQPGALPLVIRLDQDIRGGQLSPALWNRLEATMAPGAGTLNLDVYLPPGYSVDLGELSNCLSSVGSLGVGALALRVGGKLEGD